DEFVKSLSLQFAVFRKGGAATDLLEAWNGYTIWVLDIDTKAGLEPVMDYHFELMERLRDGRHDLVQHGYWNGELYARFVQNVLLKTRPSAGGGTAAPAPAGVGRGRYCSFHGKGGYGSKECNVLK